MRPAHAKVNLWLNVVGRRDDGYHLLDSLVAFVDLADQVEARPDDRLSLGLDGPLANASDQAIAGIKKGLLKVLSKMGISTIRSYRGAQIFEIVGIDETVVEEHFTGTHSRLGGIGLAMAKAFAGAGYGGCGC